MKESAEQHRQRTGHGYQQDATGWRCSRCKAKGKDKR